MVMHTLMDSPKTQCLQWLITGRGIVTYFDVLSHDYNSQLDTEQKHH